MKYTGTDSRACATIREAAAACPASDLRWIYAGPAAEPERGNRQYITVCFAAATAHMQKRPSQTAAPVDPSRHILRWAALAGLVTGKKQLLSRTDNKEKSIAPARVSCSGSKPTHSTPATTQHQPQATHVGKGSPASVDPAKRSFGSWGRKPVKT